MTDDTPVLADITKRLESRNQRELATELTISQQYLNDVIHGRRSISEKLAGKLGFKLVGKWVKTTQ